MPPPPRGTRRQRVDFDGYRGELIPAPRLMLHAADLARVPGVGLFGPTRSGKGRGALIPNLLLYPGLNLSEAEKQRMDDLDFSIENLTTDHLVYSMAKQIETNFQTFYTVAEEIVGEENALKIAHEIGRRYGGGGYAKLLQARGCGKTLTHARLVPASGSVRARPGGAAYP